MPLPIRQIAAILGVIALLNGCEQTAAPPTSSIPDPQALVAAYVGGEQCAGCHLEQAGAWTNSHHDLAMQTASPTTILGDFNEAEFEYNGVVSDFFRRGEEYWVRTDGPDGELADFRVSHTFGVDPLQQYLVELPEGRLQSLSIAWDSRPNEAGGQRWFHLYPDDTVDATDPLHWTGTFQNWNSTCAECHSTNLQKNFSLPTDSYTTSFSSVDVDCEACHGPGSLHVASPEQESLPLAVDSEAQWLFTTGTTIAQRSPARSSQQELETCAQCHSRRSQLTDDYNPGDSFLDGFRPSLLDENLYHADGQIQDEVYVYGSFLQSRMHAAGVSCSDCHDPHTTELRVEGNALCGQCHLATTYDVTEHHRHERESAGSFCVDCHMPAQTYMVVDPRRDHSFRVPRPDLSVQLGSPNACSGCHVDESADWAATVVADWYPRGRNQDPHYGQALHAGRTWDADRGSLLLDVSLDPTLPAIVRATAVTLLSGQMDDAALDAVDEILREEEPILQLAALSALQSLPPQSRIGPAQRFLTHPLRALRITAAQLLLSVRADLSERRAADLDVAFEEYRQAQFFNSDRAEGLFNWGSSLAQLGRTQEAEEFFRQAIEREPVFVASYINLADLYRSTGAEEDAHELLVQAIANNPQDPAAHFALGLSLVRAGESDNAFTELERAADLAPASPYYQYVIGIALNSNGERNRAVEALQTVHGRFPGHRETLLALATIHRDGGEVSEASVYAQRLLELSPGDPTARGLLSELEVMAP